LNDPELKAEWFAEVEGMRSRIRMMRQQLFDQLVALGGDASRYDYLLQQQGMFSYTGYTAEQARKLRDQSAIYIIDSGRICVAGLNEHNLLRVAKAMFDLDQ
jgi:aromatic-amino-acid transaminase